MLHKLLWIMGMKITTYELMERMTRGMYIFLHLHEVIAYDNVKIKLCNVHISTFAHLWLLI